MVNVMEIQSARRGLLGARLLRPKRGYVPADPEWKCTSEALNLQIRKGLFMVGLFHVTKAKQYHILQSQ